MSADTFGWNVAQLQYIGGAKLQYRNDPLYKGLPNDWTDVPNGVRGDFFTSGYQYRIKPTNYQQRLAAQAHIPTTGYTKRVNDPTPLDVQVAGSHYKDMKIQPIEYITANGLGFLEGNAIKYLTRYKAKGGVVDLQKAKHYIELLIHYEETK